MCGRRRLRSGLVGTVQPDALAQVAVQKLDPFLLAVLTAMQQPQRFLEQLRCRHRLQCGLTPSRRLHQRKVSRQEVGLLLEVLEPTAALGVSALLQRQQAQLPELPPEQGLQGSGRQQQLPSRLAGTMRDLPLTLLWTVGQGG